MAIDPERLLATVFPETATLLDERSVLLYALSVGLGSDPVDAGQLRFAYEKNLQVLPSMALVIGWPGLWFTSAASGIDAGAVVNAGHHLTLVRPLEAARTVHAHTRIIGIEDKGAGRGALVHLERELKGEDGALIGHVASSLLCRADGGCGSAGRIHEPAPAMPVTPPELCVELPTLAQSALLYRLNGDLHPLHADPAAARAAGFERPILHGLCTLAMAGHALLRALCDYDARRLTGLGARFTAPVYPGERIAFDIWQQPGGAVRFRARVPSRGATVLDHGTAAVTP